MQKNLVLRYCAGVAFLMLGPSLRGMDHQILNNRLVQAAAQGNVVEVERLLISIGVDVNCLAGYGCDKLVTPLYAATANGRTAAVICLLNHGALVDKQTMIKDTPLCKAASRGYEDIVQVLLDAKAEVNAPGERGFSPLHAAAWKTDERTIRLLLARGARVDAIDDAGNTPLFYAVIKEHSISVKLLLEAGASATYKNLRGNTPLNMACQAKNPEIVAVLTAAGGLIKIGSAIRILVNDVRLYDGRLLEKCRCCYGRPSEHYCAKCLEYSKRIDDCLKIFRAARMKNEQCPICLQDADDIKDESMKTFTPCCYAFICRADLEMLKARHEPCPLCRRPLN